MSDLHKNETQFVNGKMIDSLHTANVQTYPEKNVIVSYNEAKVTLF